MNTRDRGILAVLVVLAAFIWLRNRSWLDSSENSLPILAGLPVFIWLGSPWKWRSEPAELPLSGVIGFLLGIILEMTLLLTLAWTVVLWCWLSRRIVSTSLDNLRKLMVLPLFSFPWILLDFERIGWWFRLSGAWFVEKVFLLLQFDVTRQGTDVVVQGLPMSVEAACSGINALQSMLIAGTVLAFIFLGRSTRYWWNLPVLVVMAWMANTLRILVITVAALAVSPAFAMGTFHNWSGWLVLCLMFCLCWLVFMLQAPKRGSSSPVPA